MNYFNRFKDVEGKEKQEYEVNTPLVDRIRHEDKKLFIDGDEAFKSVFKSFCTPINVVFVAPEYEDSPRGEIYLGTGSCCHGDLHSLHTLPPLKGRSEISMKNITPIDFNVYDILPVYSKGEGDYKQGDYMGVLVCGFGCDGGGVRLVNDESHYPDIETIVSTDEFFKEGNPRVPFSFVLRDDEIRLNRLTLKLNSRLEDRGIDVKKSLEMYSIGCRSSRGVR